MEYIQGNSQVSGDFKRNSPRCVEGWVKTESHLEPVRTCSIFINHLAFDDKLASFACDNATFAGWAHRFVGILAREWGVARNVNGGALHHILQQVSVCAHEAKEVGQSRTTDARPILPSVGDSP